MFDPFETNRKGLSNRKILACVFVPLILFCIVSGAALYVALQAAERAATHPDCACKRILNYGLPQQQQKPLFVVAET